MISEVSELTRFNFEEVFRMPFCDFLGYIKYINEREKRRFLEQKKQEAKMRAMFNRR